MRHLTRYVAPLLIVAGAGVLGVAAAAWASTPPVATVRVIKISSKRYEFIPNQLTLRKGETVDIELSTEDVVMGFNVPDMATRATLIPGQVIHLRLKPERVGSFGFLCDVFCGSGHEDMNGTITVVE